MSEYEGGLPVFFKHILCENAIERDGAYSWKLVVVSRVHAKIWRFAGTSIDN